MKKQLAIFLSILFICSVHAQAGKKRPYTHGELCFIENKGQIHDQAAQPRNDIQYSVQAAGINIFLGKGQLHYQFSKRNTDKGNNIETYRMDVEVVDANVNAQVIAEEPQVYYENYYLPGCTSNGIHVHSYKSITYKNILPAIDWMVHIKNGHLEHEFIVHPGGDASQIKLKYHGQTTLNINDDGSITATTPMGTISEQAPLCYHADGRKISSSYNLQNNVLSYNVAGNKDALIIDPILEWGTYYGADTSSTYFYYVSCDDSANVYACGTTYSDIAGTIATTGSFLTTYSGNSDAFLVKFDSSGNRLWGTYYGGSEQDEATVVTPDNLGNIYLAGFSASDSGIATPGTQEPTYIASQWDGFLVKFNTAGIREWGTYVGGTAGSAFDIEIKSVSLDNFGHVYVSGACDDTSNISTPGSFKYIKTEGVDHYDCYLIQFDTSGIRRWGTYYGGNQDDYQGASCSDGVFVYLTGYTSSDTGIASPGSYQPALYNNNLDAFIAKFDSSGNRLWGTYYGGEAQEITGGIVCDESNVYLLGCTTSDTSMASVGCYQPARGGAFDAFLARFNTNTGNRVWGTYYGGPGSEYTNYGTIAIDNSGDLYFSGYTTSTTGIASLCAWQTTFAGGDNDAFLAKYNTSGIQEWATYYGGNGNDRPFACATDGNGAYICGNTTSSNNIATPGSFLSTGGGLTSYDQGFLAKFITPDVDSVTGPAGICLNTRSMLSDDMTGGIWSSGNTAILTIDTTTGSITGITTGTATITYTFDGCYTTTKNITVLSLPSAITGSDSICVHHTANLNSSPTGGTWSSSNTLVATVSNTGVVTGAAAGTTTITYTTSTGCYTTQADTIYTCITDVTNVSNDHKIEIFPNPAHNELTVIASDNIAGMTITNIIGQTVYSHTFNAQKAEVDISYLANGLYIIRINDSEVRKFIKD